MIAKQPSRTSTRRLADAIQKLRRRAASQPPPSPPRWGGGESGGSASGRKPWFDREHGVSQWDCHADCSRPDAPADLPTTHGLMLANIEGRLSKLEQQVSNQNRILLIGVIAVVGDIVRQLLKP